MSEIRIDPFSGREVITGMRSPCGGTAACLSPRYTKAEPCPFCSGEEKRTLPEVFALRDEGSAPDKPGWKVRAVPHKWGALAPGNGAYNPYTVTGGEIPGLGVHEVVIESPGHIINISELSPENLINVLFAYQNRISSIYAGNRFVRCVLVYKNQGDPMCVSVEHSHSQIIGLPFIPGNIEEEMDRSGEYFLNMKSCLGCDSARNASENGEGMVELSGKFISFVPYAPRFPFETHIYPLTHSPAFETHPEADLPELAAILRSTLMKIEMLLGNPPLSYAIHSAPPETAEEFYHWHIEIYPHIVCTGGFEWGSGVYINPMNPEDSARMLRDTSV